MGNFVSERKLKKRKLKDDVGFLLLRQMETNESSVKYEVGPIL